MPAPTPITLPDSQIGITLIGDKDRALRNHAFKGGRTGILIQDGCENIHIENFSHIDPVDGYGIYISKGKSGKTNVGVRIAGTRLTLSPNTTGQHPIRIYAVRDLVMEAGRITHASLYAGQSVNIRQAEDFVIRDYITFGRPWVFGPDKKDSELLYRVKSGIVQDCHIKMTTGVFQFLSGVDNVYFRNVTFEQMGKFPCIQPENAWKTRPGASNLIFDRCPFLGGTSLISVNKGAARFYDSTYKGVALPRLA